MLAAGDVATAAAWNVITNDVIFLGKPPSVRLNLTADATVTNGSLISWTSAAYNTDTMWSSGSTVTVNTAGIYVISFHGFVSAATSLTYAIPQINIASDSSGYYGSAGQVLTGNGAYVSQTVTTSLAAAATITFGIALSGVGTFTAKGTGNDQTRFRAAVTWIGLSA